MTDHPDDTETIEAVVAAMCDQEAMRKDRRKRPLTTLEVDRMYGYATVALDALRGLGWRSPDASLFRSGDFETWARQQDAPGWSGMPHEIKTSV